MDKRYKWPINQKRCNYLDQPPTHPRSAYQLHNKSYSRLNHNYKFSNHNASSNIYYNHQPPPPPIYAREAGGGGWPTQMPPQTDSGYSSNKNSSSDVVTLIVENNNLKKMIVLHLNLMQEQTDSLTAKDKELYEQNGRIKTLLSQNQELMQQIDKLGQRIEDLRNHLRRRAERSTHEDAEPKTKVHCSADKETQTIELSLQVEQKEQEQKSHLHSYPQKLKQSQRVLVTSVTDLPPTTPILDNSKERDKFNCGKKVSTIFLHRVHQEKSKFQLSNENEDQQLEEEKRDMEEEEVEVEEMQINMEDDEHIYHDALETHEMEVVTETIIGAEEEFCGEEETVDDIDPVNNGHIYEDGEEEEEDEEEDDEQVEENDEDEEDLKMEQEIITNNLWQQNDEPQEEPEQEEKEHHHQQLYQVISLDTPFAHSTPLFRPEILNEKKHTSHKSRSTSKPPLNKWEIYEEQEQQKLIEQQFHEFKKKNKVDSTMNDSQMQTVEMIHSEVQTEEMNDEDKNYELLCKHLRENEVRKQEQQKERDQQEERERKKREQRKRDKETAEREHSKRKQQEEEQLQQEEEAMRKRQEHLESLQQRLQRQAHQDAMKVDDTNHGLLIKGLMEHEVQKHEQQHEREQQEERECKQREQRKREKEKAEKEQSKQKQQEEIKLQQEEPNIEEEAMRKRQEHLQSQQQRLQSKPQEEEVNLDVNNYGQVLKGLRQHEVRNCEQQKEREQLEEREGKQHEQRKREKEKSEKEQSKQKLQEEKKLQPEEPNEEEAMRKRQEHLQSQQQRLQSKPRLRENEVAISEQQKEREEQDERERKQREQRKRDKEAAEKEQSKQKQQETEQLQQEEPNIEEEAMRKLQEHLQRQQQRLQNQPQQQLPYVRLKKSQMQTSLIYPPIAPATANQLSPAPSPTNIASPKIVNINNNSNNSTTTNTIIQTPLTPQSISSVGSNSNSSNTNNSTSSSNKRTIVNNCSPQTYSKSFNSLISRTSARRVSKFRTSTQLYTTRSWEDQEFHCDNEFFLEEADELLADNPSLEIPKWKVVNIRRSPDSKGTEPLSDADFERRHEKDVRDEIERKKRDARYLREQQRSDTLRMRHNQDEVLVPLDPLPTSTFYPLPMDIEGIEFVTEVPVQAFGENVVNLQVQTDDFSLPWLDAATASTAIAKAKADALPVATLASKKLPTTAAEARHQEMNSSYVFLKRRKRLRKR